MASLLDLRMYLARRVERSIRGAVGDELDGLETGRARECHPHGDGCRSAPRGAASGISPLLAHILQQICRGGSPVAPRARRRRRPGGRDRYGRCWNRPEPEAKASMIFSLPPAPRRSARNRRPCPWRWSSDRGVTPSLLAGMHAGTGAPHPALSPRRGSAGCRGGHRSRARAG